MEYRIDDLMINNLKLKQNPKGFCFGIDAVLLANFVKDKDKKILVDLCTGNGVIPVLLTAKINVEKIIGVEIQKEVAELAKENVILNSLENRVEILNDDLINMPEVLGKSTVDIVTCNPPYRTKGCGVVNEQDTKAIARHEILCDLEGVIKTSAELLKPLGKFYMVHRPDRLCDILCLMRENKIEPKTLQFIEPEHNKQPEFVLTEGIYGGKRHLTVKETITVGDIKTN